MLAISTAWNYDGFLSIQRMLREIKEAGFDTIEVGYNFTAEKLEELIALISDFDMKVVSIHNFCPLPPKPKIKRHFFDYYRISSLDETERKKAVDYTKRTIDTAKRLLCKAIVIHAGTVELEGEYIKDLIQLYKEGKNNTPKYHNLKEKFLKMRSDKKQPYLESTIKSLDEITSYAYKVGVKVGLETRYYPNEIPNIEEIEYLLSLFGNKGLVYWHDVGHAEVNERLGISLHINYLAKFKEQIFGMHIHDLIGINDHLAPFSGDFDFSKIAPYLSNENLIKVIEAHSQAKLKQIKEAKKRLLDLE